MSTSVIRQREPRVKNLVLTMKRPESNVDSFNKE